jgi:hypothetical protein
VGGGLRTGIRTSYEGGLLGVGTVSVYGARRPTTWVRIGDC